MLDKYFNGYHASSPGTRIIGSGGNINKLFKLARVKGDDKVLGVEQLADLHSRLAPLSIEERMQQFSLKDDRADVIVPAAEIFLTVAQALNCDTIMVPNISLAESIVDGIYREIKG